MTIKYMGFLFIKTDYLIGISYRTEAEGDRRVNLLAAPRGHLHRYLQQRLPVLGASSGQPALSHQAALQESRGGNTDDHLLLSGGEHCRSGFNSNRLLE